MTEGVAQCCSVGDVPDDMQLGGRCYAQDHGQERLCIASEILLVSALTMIFPVLLGLIHQLFDETSTAPS